MRVTTHLWTKRYLWVIHRVLRDFSNPSIKISSGGTARETEHPVFRTKGQRTIYVRTSSTAYQMKELRTDGAQLTR